MAGSEEDGERREEKRKGERVDIVEIIAKVSAPAVEADATAVAGAVAGEGC